MSGLVGELSTFRYFRLLFFFTCSPVLLLTCSIFRPAGEKSGRRDLNPRPLDPQSSTLAKLRHAPEKVPILL